MRRERGFALPAALFLLVVLGGLSAWLMRTTQLSLGQDALELESERAYQAAQAGLEAGLYELSVNSNCASQNIAFTGNLTRFTASVSCSATTFDEGGTTHTLYQVTSVACNQPDAGACPNAAPTLLEYSERHLRVVVEGA